MTEPLTFRVLGALEARRGDELVNLGGPKQRTVLAALLLEPNRVVAVDRLSRLVWGEEPPDKSAATLQVYVYNLRKQLRAGDGDAADTITSRRPGYLVNVEPDQLDLLQFEDLVRTARSKRGARDAPAAANLFRVALGLWRGPALSDLAAEGAGAALGAALDEQRLGVQEECFDVELALGRHSQLVPELTAAVEANPLREKLTAQLVVALYRSGRQGDALAAYRRTATRLDEELGVDPGPELRVLEQAVLRQDPTLDLDQASDRDADVSVTVHRADRGVRGAAIELPNGVRKELGARPWVLGRHPDCDIVVADSESSRRHAEIQPVPGGYTLVDLGSTNGTEVNGETVTRHRLADGDRVVIGDTALLFHQPDDRTGEPA